MLAALAFLLVACSLFVLAVAATSALQRAFQQYQARYVAPSMRQLADMFLFVEPRQLMLVNAAAMALLGAVGFLAAGTFGAALLAAAGFFAPSAAVRLHRARRRARFDAQLKDALPQMANALRAGLTFQQSVEQVGRESPPPLRQELGLLTKEVKLGAAPDESLASMVARVGSEDLELVATSASIARQLGGNLAEMFDTIAATVRDRFRLEGRIRALTSQAKLQGAIVAALPLAVGLFLDWHRPDLMRPMFDHAYGYVLVGAIALLEAIGFLLIRKISRIDV
jgi:tight adherence protein B